MEKYIKDTLDYYDNNCFIYEKKWDDIEFDIPSVFLSYLKNDANILDLGCGTGRDSRFFINHGYKVKAIDGSFKMCNIAREYLGDVVEQLNFLDIYYIDLFDGVFACASLLHLKTNDLIDVLKRISKSLKSGGIFYCSFKIGNGYRVKDDGRLFNDMTNEKFISIITSYTDFSIIKMWETNREGHIGFNNYILKKV